MAKFGAVLGQGIIDAGIYFDFYFLNLIFGNFFFLFTFIFYLK